MSRYIGIIIGSAMIAASILIPVLAPALINVALENFLAWGGLAQILGGVGTLLTRGPLQGLSTASRNPTAPWGITYGFSRPPGTIVYLQETGDENRYLHMVIVLAAHPCQSVDALLFDNQRVCLGAPVLGPSGTFDSLKPSQQTVSISSITRAADVVTVVMSSPLPLPATGAAGPAMEDGDKLRIHDITTDASLNGTYPISVVNATTFTYICGGPAVTITSQGHVTTVWPDYSTTVHMEVLLGNQTTTFPGLLDPGDTGSQGLWTNQHLLLGKTAVYLRLWYHDNIYQSGIPQIAFIVHGKCDIYDPRSGTVLARPTVLMNGWGPNAHEGPYEMGVDQATNWGLNDDVTYGYGYPERACDSDLGSCTSEIATHTHKYFGCIYRFAALSATPSDLYLNVYSSVPGGGSGWLRSAGVWYSLDSGSTWTVLYNLATKPLAWNAVHLSTSQDTSLVQVMIFMDSHDDMAHSVFDIQLATGPGSSGYTANAALCIADYLSNQIWGFKATYGTEIPYPQLIAAANICDEPVSLAAGGTEPRYQANGTFPLSMKRGEVLQNLLTSCGGRLTYSGGEFVIHPAAWPGLSFSIGAKPIASATLSLLSTHIKGTGYNAFAMGNTGVIAIVGGTTSFLHDSTAYSNRIDTTMMDPDDSANWHCILGIDGSLSGSASPPDQFLIYDCWIDVVYADGSTEVWRSNEAHVQPNGSGSIHDEANAIDSDPSTYATIQRSSFAPLGDSPYIVLRQFLPVSAGAGPPDTTESGMEVSAQALAMAAGPFRWKSKVSSRDLFNGVKGTFVSPSNSWQSSDIPAYAQDEKHGYSTDVNLIADGGDRRWLDMQLPFTISPSCAQRLAKIELLRRRQQGTGTFAFNMALYKATALDIVAFTLPLLGWNNKLLEVTSHRFTIQKGQGEGDSEVTTLGTEIDVQETDPSIYDWNPSEELTPQGFQQPVLPKMNTTSPPTAVSAVSGSTTSVVGADGIARSRILANWTPPADGYVTNGGHIEVQYQQVGDTTWTGLPTVDPSVTQVYIDGVTDGQTYNVQVRSVNAAGVPSDWVPAAPVTVSGTASALPPSSITGGGASSGDTLVWDGSAWVPGPAPPSIELQTNGVDNTLQSKLNLKSGTNVTLTADTVGGVTIAATGGGGGSVSFTSETPSGTMNGTNTAFTLSAAPTTGSLHLYLNGVEQVPTTDYSISSTTITYVIAPKATDYMIAEYTH